MAKEKIKAESIKEAGRILEMTTKKEIRDIGSILRSNAPILATMLNKYHAYLD